ncbi:MAG TPA: arginine decarboxylase, pyruvoyl-dependent [archaeon]|nr:arginine decarboxylase, pyruvoyl-dependent [archaeon]
MYVPAKMFLTKGVGHHKEKLTSFEMALRKAQIAQFNLVKVSSVFPPRCKVISRDKGLELLKPGQIVHCVMSQVSCDEPHRLISASIGVAIPKDREKYGYLSEHHGFGLTQHEAGDHAEDLAADMFATIMGLEVDIESSYDEQKELWRLGNTIVRTTNITQSAVGSKKGYWTSVLAAAILIK